MNYIGVLIEVITVIIGFFYIKKIKNTVYVEFIYLLMYVAINEIIAFILVVNFNFPNDFLYNIYDIITVLFYLYFYRAIIKNKKTKKLINYFSLLFIVSYVLEYFFLKFNLLTDNASYSPHFGSVLIIIVLILFLFEIINNEKIVFNLYKSIIFWISIGLLLFYVGSIPIFISKEIMSYNITYQYILFGLNLIMYGCFILGFILSKKEYNYIDHGEL